MKYINGHIAENENDKRFAIINPTSYNEDGQWAITICGLEELEDCGFDDDERCQLDRLSVGESWEESFYGTNARVVRLG